MQKQQHDPRVRNIDSLEQVDAFIQFAKSDAADKNLVEKIVIGPSPGSDATTWSNESLKELSTFDWSTFPKLTHLYLWSLEPLTDLGPLPPVLQCLDVRGCKALATINGILPEGLETLDLGGCVSLRSIPHVHGNRLRWIHLDGCVSIKVDQGSNELGDILARSDNLEGLTLTGCTWLLHLRLPGGKPANGQKENHIPHPGACLRKMVLRDCSNLSILPSLERYPNLQHLDLNGCSALKSLTGLTVGESADGRPTGIQTLYTADCPSLREYRRASDGSQAVDVRATHRSLTATANVARQFRALHELSNEVTELRMAKILLLGSGRCGKTTLARALRWHDYTPEERLVKRHDVKEFPIPKGGIPSTPDINFLQWEVTYGEPAHGAAPRGILHVWDFGGQEIYHQTHRLFASEGAIFIIAVTTENEQRYRARADRNAEEDQIRKLELEKLNQYREVSYWLEYIASAKGTPPGALGDVAAAAMQIAMTSPEDMSDDLFLQAAGFRDRLVESKIPRMHVRVREHEPVESIADLRAWVGKEIGKVADETGIRVPLLYAKMSEWVEQCIRDRKRRSPLSWAEWREEVASRFPTGKRFSPRATTEIAMAIAEYLHACGRLFCVRGKRGIEKVVLNQQWFVDKLYTIINPSNIAIRETLREQTSTPVDQSKMESIIGQIDGIDENELSTVMEMMDSCDMLVRIGSDRWLAVHPDLLSPLSISLEKELYETWSRVAHEQVDCGWENWSLAIHGHPSKLLLGASHFRKVCAWLARVMDGPLPTGLSRSAHGSKAARSTLGEHEDSDMRSKRAECRVWRGGMQVTMRSLDRDDAQERPAIAVRIEWNHDKEDGATVDAPPKFSGGIFLQVLSTKAKEHADALLAMMVADDGPLPEFRDRLVVGDHRSPSVSPDKIWCPRGSGQPGWSTKDGPTGPGMPWDVAVSYRRDQKEVVDSLVRALEADNLKVYHDLEDTQIYPRPDKPQGSNLNEIYDHLRRATVLIVVPSESYFETPSLDGEKAVNFYCPVELAEAINSIYDKARPANRFLWVAPPGAVMRELVQDKINDVLKQYVAVVERSIIDVFSTPIGERQVRAVNGADEGKVASVIGQVGWGQHNYVDVPLDAGGQPKVATIVQRVRQALK